MRLAIVGDLLWTRQLPDAEGVTKALDVLRSADAAFGNLEAPASRMGTPARKPVCFRMDPDRLVDVAHAGFRVLSVANNHSLDFGVDAFLDTLEQLDRRQIVTVGGGQNLEAARAAALVTIDGLRVAFLGAAATLPAGFAAEPDGPGIAPIHIIETLEVDPRISMEQPGTSPYVHTRAWPADVEAAQEAIRQARSAADLVVFATHWGVPPFWRAPFQGDLAEYQQPLGRALIDAGADLVVGHHPHSLQAIEVYRGRPIVHSLGNFLFHMPSGFDKSPSAARLPYRFTGLQDRHWTESMILVVTAAADGKFEHEMYPVRLDATGNPHLLEDIEARMLVEHLAELSRPLGGHIVFENNRGRLVLERLSH